MQRVAIVTDSTADLIPELVAQHAVTVVPLTVNLDGRSYLDGVDITAAEFYEAAAVELPPDDLAALTGPVQ